MKRLLSVFLAFAMVCSLVPAPALAEAIEEAADGADKNVAVELPAEEGFVTNVEDSLEEGPADGQESPMLVAQSDMTGTYTDDSGIKFDVRYADGLGLTITRIRIPEMNGEGVAFQPCSLDVSIPKGDIVFTTDSGSRTATIVAIAGGFDGTNPALAAVRNVFIPNTVLSIGDNVFSGNPSYYLPNLQTVTFEAAEDGPAHAGVTSIPDEAFQTSALHAIVLPTNLTYIGKYAFDGCHNLTSVDIPVSVRTIDEGGFHNCGGLTSVTFHEGLETIGDKAFDGNQGWDNRAKLTEVVFPNTLQSIGADAFIDMSTLASASLGTSMTASALTTIGNRAFRGCALSTVSIPNAVQTIGAEAFAENRDQDINQGGHYTLQTVYLGSSQEASQLQSIGSAAFFRAQITTISLPNKLTYMGYDQDTSLSNLPWTYEYGYCTKSAFYGCTQLANVDWPTQPPVDGLGLTHAGGFDNCPKLSPAVVAALPSWINTIDCFAFGQSFTQSGGQSLTIPSFVTAIRDLAFAGTCDRNCGMTYITSITIQDGDAPLTIGREAFTAWSIVGGTLVLPSRVVSLGRNAFNYDSFYERNLRPTYYIYNKDIRMSADDDPFPGMPIIYYPEDAAADSDIMQHKARFENEHGGWTEYTYMPFATYTTPTITGTVPEGATVTLLVNGEEREVELQNGTSLSAAVKDESQVSVVVSLDGYADYILRPNEAGTLEADWEFAVTTNDMTPLHSTGTLMVHVTKERATEQEALVAAIGCNVAVFDASGALVARGVTSTSMVYFAEGLLPGTYTVVAYDKNDYFKTISSVADFERLGVEEGSWATQNAEVVAGNTTSITLAVPDLSIAQADQILESGSIVVSDAHVVPGAPFFARVSYKMKDGKLADKVQVSIPAGMAPTSAATIHKNYGTAGFDPTGHVLALTNLAPGDQSETIVYVGLEVVTPGTYGVSASVASGAAAAPLGSVGISAPALELKTPEGALGSRTFQVDVFTYPDAVLNFQINDTKLMVDQTTPLSATANKVGRATATLTIPDEELSSYSFYRVTAYIPDGAGGAQAQTSGIVEYHRDDVPTNKAREWELSFVYERQRIYLVKNGSEVPNARYGVHFISSEWDYSPTWPFTAVLDSKRELGGTARLMLKMLNGDVRFEEMELQSTKSLGDGITRYTYVASVPFGDGERLHELLVKDIPCRFEVIPTYVDDVDLGAPLLLNQKEINTVKQMQVLQTNENDALLQEAYAQYRSNYASRHGGAEPPEFDPEAVQKLIFKDKFAGECYDYVVAEIDAFERWVDEGNNPSVSDLEYYKKFKQAKRDLDEIQTSAKRFFDVLQELTGASKPLYAYDSLEDYIEDTFHYHIDTGLDPTTLEAAGYTVLYDQDLEGVPEAATYNYVTEQMSVPEWRAYRLSNAGEDVIDYCDGNGNCLTVPLGDGSSLIAGQEEGDEEHPQDKDEVQEIIDRYSTLMDCLTQGSATLTALVDNWEVFEDWVLRLGFDTHEWSRLSTYNPPPDPKDWGLIRKGFSGLLHGANFVFWLWMYGTETRNLFGRANTLMDIQISLEENSGRQGSHPWPASACDQALAAEGDALRGYRAQVARSAAYSYANMCVSSTIYALGLGSGAFSAGVGAAAGVAVGMAWAAGYSYCKGTVDNAVNAAKDDYEIKKHFREIQCGDARDPKHGANVVIDPSGYVYEGVEDNRIADVTATVQYSEDGGNTWSTWDAASFDQINPQVTDASGIFAWDVPMGLWRVVFSHADYEDTQTEAMEVPPERKGLAIPLVSRFTPTVESVTADDQVMEVVFHQYMDMSEAPAVAVGGIVLTGGEWADATPVNDTAGAVSYARVWRVSVPAGTMLGSTLPVAVSGAKSYAGKAMQSPWTGDVTVAPRPTQIVLDYDEVVSQRVGTDRELRVRVLDASGAPIEGAQVVATGSNAEFATVTGADEQTDTMGVTVAQIEAHEPGTSMLELRVVGTSLSRRVDLLTTLDAHAAEKPSATLAGQPAAAGEQVVNAGAKLSLACTTEGAVVYYTTDGTDPRAAGPSRKTYDGAIEVGADMRVRTVAYADGMDFSEEVEWRLRVRKDVARAQVASIPAQTYTGKALTPKPSVMLDGKVLREGIDYTLAYANNVNAGTATVTITGKGDYTGSKRVTFGIAAPAPAPTPAAHVAYQTHVQRVGWQDWRRDGAMAGTSRRSLRLEGINIRLEGQAFPGSVEYRTHVQRVGWQGYVRDGAMSGTSGRSLRLEAIQVRLTGEMAARYDVWYRVHAQTYGWLGWARNDSPAGTAGLSKRLEAIEVRVLPKGSAAPGEAFGAFVTKKGDSPAQSYGGHDVLYKTHVQTYGWQGWVADGQTSGTTGLAKRLEGIEMRLNGQPCPGSVEYRTHVQRVGWQGYVRDGQMSGTSGRSLRLEAIQVRLTGEMAARYDVWYCVHAQRLGWMGWAKNDERAGTAGFAYRLEGIQVLVLPKGSPAPGPTGGAFRQR